MLGKKNNFGDFFPKKMEFECFAEKIGNKEVWLWIKNRIQGCFLK